MSERGWRICAFLLAVAIVACAAGRTPTVAQRVFTVDQAECTLWPGGIQVDYREPTEEQRRALDALIGRLWVGVVPGPARELAALAAQAGMTLELWRIGGRPTWVVRERTTEQRGLGIYLIHAAIPPSRPVLLQAPHVYFDRRTQGIAAAMFWATDARPELHGLFTNSVHRFQQHTGARDKRGFNPADVAHNSMHPFQTATAAVLEVGPLVVLQLHGFDGDNVEPTITAIVSAARPEGSTVESALAATTLAEALDLSVARFPEDIQSLGGLENVQGRLVSATTSARFVHVELELRLRNRLRDPAIAARWVRSFVAGLAAQAPP